jgi:hypothetical protein
MARVGRKSKQIIRDLMQCKAEGICERDKIVSDYLRAGMVSWMDGRAAVVEAMRCHMELPPCPPVCPEPIEVVTITQTEVEIV